MKYFIEIRDFFYYNRKIIIVIILLIAMILVIFKIQNPKIKVLSKDTLFIEEKISIEEEKYKEEIKHVEVSISGEIKLPGTYSVVVDSTIEDVIRTAGGLLEYSNVKELDLNEKVTAGMSIVIDKLIVEEPKAETKEPTYYEEKVNINTGNITELMKLKGIGKVKAEAIIDYRNKNGHFKMKEDLMNVKGIGIATFEKIKDNIRI